MERDSRLKEAADALRRQDASTAETLLRELLAADPDDADALLYLGIAHGLRGDLGAARGWLERAGELAPGDARAPFNLARIDHRLGRLDAARAGYQATLRRDPTHAGAHDALASLGTASAPQPRPPWDAPAEDPPATVEGLEPEPRPAFGRLSGDWLVRAVGVWSYFKPVLVIGLLWAPLQAAVTIGMELLLGRELGWENAWGPLVAIVLVPPLGGLLTPLFWNLAARWFGPLQLELEPRGGNTAVRRVDPVSAARLYTATTGLAAMLVMVVMVPILLVVMMSSGTVGASAARPVLIGMLIGLGVGAVLVVGGFFVVALAASSLYNACVGLTGGVQFKHRWDEAEGLEIRAIAVWPSLLSVLPVMLLVAMIGSGFIFFLHSFARLQPADLVNALLVTPSLRLANLAFSFAVYNVLAPRLGPVVLTVEEE